MKFLFLFKEGRRDMLVRHDSNGPNDFFYGFLGIKNIYPSSEFIEETDFVGLKNRVFLNWISHLTNRIFCLPGLHLILGLFKHFSRRNNDFNVITTSNSLGIALIIVSFFCVKLRTPRNFCFFMGLADILNNSVMARVIYKYLIRNGTADLIFISRFEKDWAAKFFGLPNRIHYLPFGVDMKFWNQEKATVDRELAPSPDFVLSIGSDLNRDYDLLLESWQDDYPHLLIITKLKIANRVNKNVTIWNGSIHDHFVSDIELKWLYQNSEFVIIPTKDCWQPSGQSCLFQAMASGALCIAGSNCRRWDPALLACDGFLSYQEGNSTSLKNVVGKASSMHKVEKKRRQDEASDTIERFFTSEILVTNLIDIAS